MNLVILRDRLSVLQILLAVATVWLGNGLSLISLAIAGIAGALAFVVPLPPEPSRRTQRLWTALVFVGLTLSLVRAFTRSEFLDAGVDFLLLLVVQRLWNRQRAREHGQLLLLGALFVVVGAVINAGLNFPALFAAYLVVASMGMIVNHLLSEGERLGARVMLDVGREGARRQRRLWGAATQVAGLATVGALAVFLLFPRFGAGVFLRGALAGETRSGFSNEVQLGQFGRIKDDASVVMRLRPNDTDHSPVDRLEWHLRGTAFDQYRDGRWQHSGRGEKVPLTSIRGFLRLTPDGNPTFRTRRRDIGRVSPAIPAAYPVDGFAASTEIAWVTVTLEDMGADVAFLASEPLGVRLVPRGMLEQQIRFASGDEREIRTSKPPGPLQYEFISRIGEPTRTELRAVGEPELPSGFESYLELPEDLGDEFHALSRELTAGATTRADKVLAVMEHLSTFDYTTDLRPATRVVQGGDDPIEGFLFELREGHCEYFASAMALLLRDAGVPTRIVNGYYGAHWNDLGGFYAVRQADAHSWVEVWFGPLGWVTFDPTPPDGRTAGDQAVWFPGLANAVDALRNRYLEYVIDYNLTKQIALLENLGFQVDSQRPTLRWQAAFLWVLGAGALGWLFVLVRLRRRGPVAAEVRVYQRVLADLARRGHARRTDESATGFAARLRREGAPEAAALADFAAAYEAVRFGPAAAGAASSAALTELQRLARRVRTPGGGGA